MILSECVRWFFVKLVVLVGFRICVFVVRCCSVVECRILVWLWVKLLCLE